MNRMTYIGTYRSTTTLCARIPPSCARGAVVHRILLSHAGSTSTAVATKTMWHIILVPPPCPFSHSVKEKPVLPKPPSSSPPRPFACHHTGFSPERRRRLPSH